MAVEPAGYRYATQRWDTNGEQTDYEINFEGGYISQSHVYAYSVLIIDGEQTDVQTHAVTFLSENGDSATVRVPVILAGRVLTIYRDTPKDAPLGDFTNKSVLTKENLNLMWRQAILSAAEVQDRLADLGLDMSLALTTIRDDIDNGGGGGGGGNDEVAREIAEQALDLAELASTAAANATSQALAAMQAITGVLNDIEGINDDLGEISQQAIDNAAAIIAEALARADAIQQVASTAAADLLAEITTRGAQIANLQAAIVDGDNALALQISQLSVGNADAFDTQVIWYFDASNDAWTGGTWVNGFLHTSAAAADSPTFVANGDAYRHFRARVQRVGTPTWTGKLRYKNQGGAWSAYVDIPEPQWDGDGIGTLSIQNPGWGVSLVQVGVQFLGTTGVNYYKLDWAAIGRPTPGASTAAVQSLSQAMVTADTALALSRDVLAAQMRGNYLGNNVQELTTGLVYQERIARASQDSALASSITALSASMNTALGTVNASITAEQTARVNADNALATSIDVAEAAIEGKASTAALNALSATVVTQGNTIAAQATSISGVQAGLGAISASVAQVANPSFEVDTGWGAASDGTGALGTGISYVSSDRVTGVRCIRALNSFGDRVIWNAGVTPVRAGQKVGVSFQYKAVGIGVAGLGVVFRVHWLNSAGAEISNQQVVAAGPQAGNTAWVNRGIELIVPNGAIVALRIALIFVANTAGTQYVDDVLVRFVTPIEDANAAATTALTVRVGTAEGTISALGQALTTVSASIPDEPANLVPTSDFNDGPGHWVNALVGTPEYTGPHAVPGNIYQGPHLYAASAAEVRVPSFQVTPRETLEVQANLYKPPGMGTDTGVSLWFFQSNESLSISIVHVLSATAGAWENKFATVVVPDGAQICKVFLRAAWAGQLRITQPRVSRLAARLVQNASATTLLDARVVQTEAGLTQYRASWTLALDSNGYAAGIQAVNNGVLSGITFRMDSFAIVGTPGQPRTEFSAGNWRVYDGSGALRVRMGIW